MAETENKLTKAVEKYLDYYRDQTSGKTISHAKRALTGFAAHLQTSNTPLDNISIQQVDHFLALYNANYSTGTARTNRSYLRQFLKYLYRYGHIKKDLSQLVVSPPEFARSKPPKFLRPHEIQKLFSSLDLSTAKDLRTNATLHLAYYLGLRPKEIRLLTLDDISFRQKEIFIRSRKNCDPAHLPVSDNVIKAIAAYIVGARPETQSRVLFLQLIPPYKPVNRCDIPRYIKECMTENNLESSTYWLRHSYAQNLLESGASIYEIKEMMGHKNIGSTQKYLSVHINLMREVILDETL
ncbi:tyrosine-type recombinase/integrase [uncultured Desulfobacter sp.]|uniref:tyrosine-type recombinase/integrase n=1 Tax=uncultured Desulfobacter sp. TaxID=240139 RepID=UPI002AAAF331|nr:tyrosine-type recombinase/integrase [uncultured Desulfobacter sp.]